MKDTSDRWDPDLYLRFADLRLRPALELLQRVPLEAPGVVHDLGCGAGQVTRLLARRWPEARVLGVDRSQEMLERARREPGGIVWVRADLADWGPERWGAGGAPDLVFSNAALHWLPDHATLFPRLLGWLRPGGCLAVQMPLSDGAPSHVLMRRTLADGGPGGRPLGSPELRRALERPRVGSPGAYVELLAERVHSLDLWETEVHQFLEPTGSEHPVLAWVRSTGLRPVLEGLEPEERALFLERYEERLRAVYPADAEGRVVYPFRRLFLVARV